MQFISDHFKYLNKYNFIIISRIGGFGLSLNKMPRDFDTLLGLLPDEINLIICLMAM